MLGPLQQDPNDITPTVLGVVLFFAVLARACVRACVRVCVARARACVSVFMGLVVALCNCWLYLS